jgi:plasmid stabilization system protein ParE
MANKIVWSETSHRTFYQVINYLEKEWSEKEVINFVNVVHAKLEVLKTFPDIGVPFKKYVHRTVIHKKVTLVYRHYPRKKEIKLLSFWNTQQNPKGLRF